MSNGDLHYGAFSVELISNIPEQIGMHRVQGDFLDHTILVTGLSIVPTHSEDGG